MHPISPAHPALPALFDVTYLHFVVNAMGVGNSPALVWADDTHMPTAAFIWDKTHSLYFGGDAHNEAFNQPLREFFAESLIPKAQQDQLGILKLYFANDDWRTEIASLLPDITLQNRARVLHRLNPATEPAPAAPLPPQMQVQLIDADFLENNTLTGINALINEIESCWTSLEHFTDQAFGYCIVDETAGVVSWCTAEYVSPGVCGIGIETLEPYQKHGLATVTAQTFVQHAQRLGWQVHWDSWLSNTPSIRVAQKTGFERVTEYSVWVAHLGA